MAKQIGKIILLLAVSLAAGAMGGMLAFSYFAGLVPFESKNFESLAPIRITEKRETVIQENKALKEAVAKISGIAVGVKITAGSGAPVYGSGLIFTSDGMVAIPYRLFPPGASAVVTAGGKPAAFEVIKRDKAQNLVILKLEGANWPTAGFYALENLKIGERIFISGILPDGGNFANEGIVRDFTLETINTNISEKSDVLGSPAFDIEGNIVGIADIGKTGSVNIIPISKIKNLSAL